ncbi:MAG: hypothetical protein K9M55_07900, partial [Candidatus Marinimicrobia bacterium]|nr:hypothetical protein [Candidatus Neomarinimicrobiota bacterium]
DQSSWWWKLLGPISALVSWLSEDSFQLRRKNGTFYLVKKDFGVFQKLWIVAGGLLNISPSLYIERGLLLSWSRFDIYVPSSNITLFDWGRWTIPGEDWTLPNIGVQMTIYRLASGGLQQVATESLSIFPMPDANPSASEMTERYGPVINLNSSANIPHSRIRAFLDEEGYQADRAEILTRFDLDERNTYAIVKAQKKKNDLSGSTLLLSFETTYDDHYEVHFRDEKASEILNFLAAVSNRYWLIDNADRVHLLEKEHTGSTFIIQQADLLSITQTEEKVLEHVTQIKRYEEDQTGKVTSWGIKLRKNEYEAIMNDLEADQEKSLNKTDVEVIRRTGAALLNEAQMDGVSYGQVMVRSQHLYNPIDKLKLEVRI